MDSGSCASSKICVMASRTRPGAFLFSKFHRQMIRRRDVIGQYSEDVGGGQQVQDATVAAAGALGDESGGQVGQGDVVVGAGTTSPYRPAMDIEKYI